MLNGMQLRRVRRRRGPGAARPSRTNPRFWAQGWYRLCDRNTVDMQPTAPDKRQGTSIAATASAIEKQRRMPPGGRISHLIEAIRGRAKLRRASTIVGKLELRQAAAAAAAEQADDKGTAVMRLQRVRRKRSTLRPTPDHARDRFRSSRFRNDDRRRGFSLASYCPSRGAGLHGMFTGNTC